jgi:hypothetical protein
VLLLPLPLLHEEGTVLLLLSLVQAVEVFDPR